MTDDLHNPRYPLYIVSKKRADSRLTVKALEKMKVPYFIVIEQADYEDYSAVINPSHILILPERYFDEYDCFDDLGRTKSTWPGPARNFAWDHSISLGAKWHWVMDDNILKFWRLNKNMKLPVWDGTCFRCMEDFCDRYENISMAWPNYYMFASRKSVMPPFVMNTRIYSYNLIRNDTPYRWRGRYNEDTDISLRMLKDWWCTVQFNAFLQEKIKTQTLKGGNTGEFYAKEWTRPKSEMQVAMHPDVSRIVYKFGRIHHHVDYWPFKHNKLIRKKSIQFDKLEKVDEYNMALYQKEWEALKKIKL